MSDETSAAGSEAGEQPQPQVQLLSHFIRDMSFENIAAVEGLQNDGPPEITVNVNLDAKPAGDETFSVAMKINATAKSGENTRFLVELDYAGIFGIRNVPQEHMHPFLFIECPRLLLPFARRVVADVTRDGGYPPLMLDNVDFSILYRQRIAQIQAEQQAQGAPN